VQSEARDEEANNPPIQPVQAEDRSIVTDAKNMIKRVLKNYMSSYSKTVEYHKELEKHLSEDTKKDIKTEKLKIIRIFTSLLTLCWTA